EGNDEAPVLTELLGGRPALEDRHRAADVLQAVVPELFKRVVSRVVYVRLRRDDLVEQLARAMLGARLGVRLGHRDRLAEHPATPGPTHAPPGVGRPLGPPLPFLGRKGALRRHAPPLSGWGGAPLRAGRAGLCGGAQ